MPMQCGFFEQRLCNSCNQCLTPYSQQLQQKDKTLRDLMQKQMPEEWQTPISSTETGFRNKAKMVVLGAAHAPILGIETELDGQVIPVSLVDCPLYPPDTRALLAYLQDWIRIAGIPPYNKLRKKGELKFLLLTRSESRQEFMLRFILRSHTAIPRIEKNLARLLGEFPAIKVASVNIQPIHMARLEGDEEIFLSTNDSLQDRLNDVPMVIRPKSFFQTNPAVAEKLYATARAWTHEIKAKRVWDLFCGVGGFALHCASPANHVTGIEIEPEAIASAQRSAAEMGLTNLDFSAMDSTEFSLQQRQSPDLVIVNPPRRGLGQTLARQLSELGPAHILYSSCNPHTLLLDLQHMPNFTPARLQWFDMFPHTEHAEVLLLLRRTAV